MVIRSPVAPCDSVRTPSGHPRHVTEAKKGPISPTSTRRLERTVDSQLVRTGAHGCGADGIVRQEGLRIASLALSHDRFRRRRRSRLHHRDLEQAPRETPSQSPAFGGEERLA